MPNFTFIHALPVLLVPNLDVHNEYVTHLSRLVVGTVYGVARNLAPAFVYFLFAQCVVLMSFRGPQEATLNSCTEHRTSSTQALTCTVHWQLLVQACLACSAFLRCLVTYPLRSSDCRVSAWLIHLT
jgi:hypothetical protein